MTDLANNTWTPPTTGGTLDLTTGGTVTEAYIDALANNFRYLGGSTGTYSAKVTNGTAISVPDSTWTPINHDTDSWDPEGWHVTAGAGNADVVVAYAGKYEVRAHHYFAGTPGGYRSLKIYFNGTASHYMNTGTIPANAVVPIELTDYLDITAVPGTVSVQAWQNSGDALTIAAGGYLFVKRV